MGNPGFRPVEKAAPTSSGPLLIVASATAGLLAGVLNPMMHVAPEPSGGVYSVANLLAEKAKALPSTESEAKYRREMLDWQRLGATIALQQKLALMQQGELCLALPSCQAA